MEPVHTLTRHEVARKAARARWGEPRVVRLDDLSEEERAVVRALVEMVRAPRTDKPAA